MKKQLFLLTIVAMIFMYSCSNSGNKKEQLTDPQIDAKIGVVRGHVKYIGGYAVSPDGKNIVTVKSFDYIFWNAQDGSEIKAVRSEKYDKSMFNYTSAKYTPDGKLVIISGYYGIKIIDAKNMTELKTLTFDHFNGSAYDISKDGKYLVIADGSEFKVIDLSSYEIVKTFGETENNYTEIAFLNNTEFLALEYSSEDMYLWDIEKGQDIMAFSIPESNELLATSNDGKYIAVFDDDQDNVILFNSETSEEKIIQTGYANDITFMNDKLVTLGSIKINIFDTETGEKTKTFDLGGSNIQYDSTNNLLFYTDKSLIAVNPEDGSIVKNFGNDAQGIFAALPSPTGKFIVLETAHKSYSGGYNLFSLPVDTTASVNLFETAGLDFGIADYTGKSDNIATVVTNGDITVYDLYSGKSLHQYEDVANEPLVFTPDGQKLIAKDYNQSSNYVLFNFNGMQKIADLTNSSAYVQYAGITPDGKYYVLSDNNGVFVYDIEAGQEVTFDYELDDTKWVDQMNDQYVAVRAESSDLSIVNLLTGEIIISFEDVEASRVAISPDKNFLAIAPRDHFGIYLYDFNADDWKPVLYGHNYFPSNVAFTADSKYLISTGQDNQTIIWDVATGKRILTIIIYDLANDGNSSSTKDYIVYAPNGRYDGTPEAIKRFLYFEKDGKRYPASDYKEQCYTPNLLGKTLGQNFISN